MRDLWTSECPGVEFAVTKPNQIGSEKRRRSNTLLLGRILHVPSIPVGRLLACITCVLHHVGTMAARDLAMMTNESSERQGHRLGMFVSDL